MNYQCLRYVFLMLLASANITSGGQTRIEVMVDQPEKLEITALGDLVTKTGQFAVFGENLEITGGKVPYQYYWYENELLIGTNPSVQIPEFIRSLAYSLKVTDSRSCSVVFVIPVDVELPIGIEDESGRYSISVYPVPAQNRLTINPHDYPGELDIILYDSNGVPVLKKLIMGESSIDIKLPSGIYILRIMSGPKNIGMKKIMIL
jgi:hypothetical protein